MKRYVGAIALVLSLASPWQAQAADGITVKDAWLRATPRGAKVAGGYVTIVNTGSTPDRLVAASIPTAARGEIHTMTMEGGVMHMARLGDGLPIAPGATVTLMPGADHLMFIDPSAVLTEGERVAGTLTFAKAGTMTVTFTVAGMAAKVAPEPAKGL